MALAKLIIKAGTRDKITAAKYANNLNAGEPYFVTDEARIEIGTGAGTSEPMAKLAELGGAQRQHQQPAWSHSRAGGSG